MWTFPKTRVCVAAAATTRPQVPATDRHRINDCTATGRELPQSRSRIASYTKGAGYPASRRKTLPRKKRGATSGESKKKRGRPGITLDGVRAAWESLEKQGRAVTPNNVRLELGGTGSFETIMTHMRALGWTGKRKQ